MYCRFYLICSTVSVRFYRQRNKSRYKYLSHICWYSTQIGLSRERKPSLALISFFLHSVGGTPPILFSGEGRRKKIREKFLDRQRLRDGNYWGVRASDESKPCLLDVYCCTFIARGERGHSTVPNKRQMWMVKDRCFTMNVDRDEKRDICS